ncbi:MAG: M50 family metallopeptidase [Oscillospiraceae bacterium]
MYIILAIIFFGILIAIHEFGHFSAAKLLGVKVNEFAIGMGPAIFKKQKGETLYSLRCLPIGGYCAMEGEDEDTGDPRSFTTQPGWKRFIILVAGSFMNFLLGFLIVLIIYSGVAGFYSPVISGFVDGCPYEGTLQTGDELYSIDGHRIYFASNVTTILSRGGETHDVVVIRDGEKLEFEDMELTPQVYEGYSSPMYGFSFAVEEANLWSTLKYSWYNTIDFVRTVWFALSDLVAGTMGVDDLAGPVGIVDLINDVGQSAESTKMAMADIAYLGALVAVNIAVMNLLPLPALDGGRVFLLLLNGLVHLVSRRRIPARYEGYVHAAGMVLLLGLSAYVMYNDIARLIT